MKQPQLYIILDHTLNFSDKESCIARLKNIFIKEELEQYLLYASHLSNQEPENTQDIQIEKQDTDGTIWLTTNNIHIKIQKHIIQLKFPIIFRTFFDYDYLRESIYELLKKIFIPCGSTEMSIFPSYWLYDNYEIKNDWHKRRLLILQEKICNQCTSYKRTKLNLRQCLSNEIEDIKEMKNKQYKVWFVKKIS
jgi:predicted nuclease of predicted toxin-antitoxin system